jgi:uncharacterized protein YqhQ
LNGGNNLICFAKKYLNIIDKCQNFLIFVSFISIFSIAAIVYFTGGTIQVYENLMFIPIVVGLAVPGTILVT